MVYQEGKMISGEFKGESGPPVELTSEEDFIKFWLAFDRNNGLTLRDADQERRIATAHAQLSMRELKYQKAPIHFFGIKNKEDIIASGKLDIITVKDQKHAHLSLVSVDEKYRGKGVGKDLGYRMVEQAIKYGCTHIDTEVFTTNPISLVAQFKEGFVLVDLKFYGDDQQAGAFILSRKIEGEAEYDKKKEIGELEEVLLTDLFAIKTLLGQGWVGINIKNLGEAKDKDPGQWKLIMEKTTKSE